MKANPYYVMRNYHIRHYSQSYNSKKESNFTLTSPFSTEFLNFKDVQVAFGETNIFCALVKELRRCKTSVSAREQKVSDSGYEKNPISLTKASRGSQKLAPIQFPRSYMEMVHMKKVVCQT